MGIELETITPGDGMQ